MFWYISIIHKIWELNEMIKVMDKIEVTFQSNYYVIRSSMIITLENIKVCLFRRVLALLI